MKEVRIVIWDLDDTVWCYKKNHAETLCQKLNISKQEKFKEEYYRALANLMIRFKDEIVTYDKVKAYIDEQIPTLKLSNTSVEEFLKIFCMQKSEIADINQDAIEMMKWLRKKGIRNISVTDWFEVEQEMSLTEFGVNTYIEKIYGCDNGYFKNSVGKVSQISSELQLEQRREEFIIVGDSLSSDIFFAKQLGIKSVWYNPTGKKNVTNIIPTFEVKNLLELKELF